MRIGVVVFVYPDVTSYGFDYRLADGHFHIGILYEFFPFSSEFKCRKRKEQMFKAQSPFF